MAWVTACLAVAPQVVRANSPDVPIDRHDILKHLQSDDIGEAEIEEWLDIAEEIKSAAKRHYTFVGRIKRALLNPWVFFGLFAQFLFMMRFVIQLVASERKKRSYVPVAFWYLSLAGGVMLFIYAFERRDPVFVFGQGLGCIIYVRNLILIHRRKEMLDTKLAERQDGNGESND